MNSFMFNEYIYIYIYIIIHILKLSASLSLFMNKMVHLKMFQIHLRSL